MKNTVIIISVLFVVGFSVVAIRAGSVVSDAQRELNEERYLRMVAEEGLEKAKGKINSLEADLSRTQGKLKSFEQLIKETKGLNEDLKTKLDRTSRINDELDKKLKELNIGGQESAQATPAN